MEAWGENEENFLQAMKKTRDHSVLAPLAEKLDAPNAVHLWREADFTLLFHASVENNPVAFQLVLDKGGDPTRANNRGTNVLMLIMRRSQLDMADMCLAKIGEEGRAREFVNAKTEPGWTALMTAAENNQVEAARWLLKQGARASHAMETGWTAAHAAAKRGHADILEMLLEAGADRHARAAHREFGKNLELEDVTNDKAILQLLAKYP